MTIIQTSQAPDAKQVAVSITAPTSWETIVSAPEYEVPQQSFGGGTDIVPGVAEIITPLLVANKTTNTAKISIRMFRASSNTHFTVANLIPIPAYDMVPIPLNGQFVYTGDELSVESDTADALDVTISYTVGQAEEDDVI